MRFLFLLIIFQLFIIHGHTQPAAHRIDSLMKSFYLPDQPGAVIAITRNHKTIFKKGYGLADLVSRKPITPGVSFNIGSLTKQFTAFGVLTLLHYKREFSLDDSIGKFLKLPAPISAIQIKELLNHCSGIPDHYGFVDTGIIKHATDKDVLTAIRGADSLYFPSGTQYRYSNTAYCLLGMVIEKISGMSYADYLQQEIFSKLDMKDASVFNFNKPVKHRVIGYERLKNGRFVKADAEESVFYSTEADGGIYISMNDYMKWCAAIESGKFAGSETMKIAWEGQTLIDTAGSLWYGNGWFIQQAVQSPKIVYHTGFNGGFRSAVLIIPSLDYCISIFSNRSDTDLEDLISRIDLILSIPDNSFIKSGPLESFIHSWPTFAPWKETSSFSTLFRKNLNAKGMVLN